MTRQTRKTGQAADAEQSSFALTLDEFCIRLSKTDRRVELIGGFNAVERQAGRIKDTEANYLDRYHVFIKQPA